MATQKRGMLYFAQKGMVFDESHTKILLIKNISARYTAAKMLNKLALPGGKIEFNTSPDESCIKEIQEETGILVTPHFPIYTWSFSYVRENVPVQIVATVRLCKATGGKLRQSRVEQETEIGQVGWYEVASLHVSEMVYDEAPAVTFAKEHHSLIETLLQTPYIVHA